MTLPLILAANEEIGMRRAAIKRAASANDRGALEKWAQLYRIDVGKQSAQDLRDDILLRADVIPVSLALAQAAVESGWGTSRFAVQGNALFGQWAWKESAGLKPLQASNDKAVVRSFPNLFGSVRAYMHNLKHAFKLQTICAGNGHGWLTEMSVARAMRWLETWIAMPKLAWNMSTSCAPSSG